ncbi:MAG: transcription-repair coupling factor [Bacteroides sp.]|nr:transcription-repair coupling factor [Bacteroides sp.]MCM1084954.1 transcription-repair coupling factor [Bacteroides sp.]
MEKEDLLRLYAQDGRVRQAKEALAGESPRAVALCGLAGSSQAVVCHVLAQEFSGNQLFILRDREQAAYFCNDLEKLSGEEPGHGQGKKTLFFPASYRRPYDSESVDNANVLSRTEVLERLQNRKQGLRIVTYPEALAEKVIDNKQLASNTVNIHVGEQITQDFLTEFLDRYHFRLVDFVAEPGEFALRGGILDVFSYSADLPFRIEFDDESVRSIRSFEVGNQLSVERLQQVSLIPDIQQCVSVQQRVGVFSYFEKDACLWVEDAAWCLESLGSSMQKAEEAYGRLDKTVPRSKPGELYCSPQEIEDFMRQHRLVELGSSLKFAIDNRIEFSTEPQPVFNKKFELLADYILDGSDHGFTYIILSENAKQFQRLDRVFFELSKPDRPIRYTPLQLSLHEGFVDSGLKLACFTDHQIFERYHRFSVQPRRSDSQALSLKELYALKPGDYIMHVDHGVGRFAGLEKVMVNGREQEAICLLYKDNDMLRLSIHGLHKMTRYTGREGVAPVLNRIGGNTWTVQKNKAKQKVKDMARELIDLYARRKESKGFAFSADSYLQNELESSFFYEDTPDQLKASNDVKRDMEAPQPMDRLVCGDVGFGKTEVAVRAAFKAVCDGKQVAVLVPTTILAYQHYKTFSERLENFPCKVEYINRFRTAKVQKQVLREVEAGTVDILIGTHRLLGKDVKFKDLGLLVIDEEQKFGVAMKEKLKTLKVNVDTLTLTATPIPRTLQFSLMGARDLSIIQTPPPNRYPVATEIMPFSEERIRDAVEYELSRRGQVYFVHDRVQNIMEVAGMVQRLVPDAHIAVAHGQMEGDKLEEIMLGFMEGEYDILVCTKIVENGLDVPNANTIIVNDAHRYGLSELHQLRGRVGRSNKKAFCYMVAPPPHLLTPEAKRRLRAIEEFSDIGGGFQVAMRDLDIRGSGNILGGEQSGFISEIGFEMYQRILDDAIRELRQERLQAGETVPDSLVSKNGEDERFAASDCQIDTDLEILIPDSYVSNITERLSLYKKLDGLSSDSDLKAFAESLADRFGPVPVPTLDLIRTIALRREARKLGFDKVSLKNGRMTVVLAAPNESAYYQSPVFEKILAFVQDHPSECRLQEVKSKLAIVFEGIQGVKAAVERCAALQGEG